MRCEAQSVPCGTATQAICNDAARPNPAEQMGKLLLSEPLGLARPRDPGWSGLRSGLFTGSLMSRLEFTAPTHN